jgi:citrate synthase
VTLVLIKSAVNILFYRDFEYVPFSDLFLRNVFIQLEKEDVHVFMHHALQNVLVRLTELSNIEQTTNLLKILKENTAEMLNDGKSRKVMCSLLLQVAEFSCDGEADRGTEENEDQVEALREVFLEICQGLKGDIENVLVVKTVLQVLSGQVSMSAKDLGMNNMCV